MNQMKLLGVMHLTMGIAAFIYALILFANILVGVQEVNAAIIYSVLGFLFFMSGILLVRIPNYTV